MTYTSSLRFTCTCVVKGVRDLATRKPAPRALHWKGYLSGGEDEPVRRAVVGSVAHAGGVPIRMGTVTETCSGQGVQTRRKYAHAVLPIVTAPSLSLPLKKRAFSRRFRSRVSWSDFNPMSATGRIAFSSK